MKDAIRALEPDEIEAIERFVARLQDEGPLGPEAAARWRIALERFPKRRHPLAFRQR